MLHNNVYRSVFFFLLEVIYLLIDWMVELLTD